MLFKTGFLSCKIAKSMTVIPTLPSKSQILSLGFLTGMAADGYLPVAQNSHPSNFDEGKKMPLPFNFLTKRAF